MPERAEINQYLLPRYTLIFITSLFFINTLLFLPVKDIALLADTDPLWHLAAGDWIREHKSIPFSDPWSFTTAGYQWLNISWLWDTALSYIHEHLGWHTAIVLNAIIVAFTLALIYVHCAIRSSSLFISLLMVVAIAPLLVINLRPLQITSIMTALWIFLLGSILRRQVHARWLALLPLSMVIWVNCHGGFVVGCIMLAAFFLQTLLTKDRAMALQLFVTGITCLIALWCNPYHMRIIEAVWRPLTTTANDFISEWQPLSTNAESLFKYWYLFLFLILPLWKQRGIFAVELLLAYFWLVMGLISSRHITIFAIISAPLTALTLHNILRAGLPNTMTTLSNIALRYNDSGPAKILLGLCVLATLILPLPAMAPLYKHTDIKIATLKPETEFLMQHYPNARLLTHFDIAAILVYETRGKVPVFIDPRTETAFPPQVMQDFKDFLLVTPGWEAIWEKYQMNGLIIPNTDHKTMDRFQHRRGWKEVFKGPTATIFIRTGQEND